MRKADLFYNIDYVLIHDQESGFHGRYVWELTCFERYARHEQTYHKETMEEIAKLMIDLEAKNKENEKHE
jgi:hypothetical protein